MGWIAGKSNQGTFAVAIGYEAGATFQGTGSVAIGERAGRVTQGIQSIAIGSESGQTVQASQAIAIGVLAGAFTQGRYGIAIGFNAGQRGQQSGSIAIGYLAGNVGVTLGAATGQDINAIAIGVSSGQTAQKSGAIAIGFQAGCTFQGTNAIAIGLGAGQNTQGTNAIAIGQFAGQTSQAANTIVLNALGTAVTGATASATYIAPIRNVTQTRALGYNITTSEVTYYNQNAVASPSGLPTSIPSVDTNQTLTVNFNNSFSSVTNYTVSFTAGSITTQTITAYTLSGGITGGQYTVVIQLVCSGIGTTTWVFNGPSLSGQRSNFTTISTTAMNSGATRYVVLTFAYDGTQYFISGSNFS